jgi:aspartate/methionine/tyrosine aminotransferase
MTGWRVGYAVVPPDVADVVAKVQEPLVSCLNAPAQYGALAALKSPPEVVESMVSAYRRRRDAVVRCLDEFALPVFRPAGAFYVWLDIGACGLDSRRFALRLLAEENVAVAPGSAFGGGGEGYVRLSLAASEADLIEGASRLARLLKQLG